MSTHVYTFYGRFEPLIKAGGKRQTMRSIGGERHAQPGDRLELINQDNNKRIDSAICQSTHRVEIFRERAGLGCWQIAIAVCGKRLNNMGAFAKEEGFEDIGDLESFIEHRYGLPFEGILIKW